jgi:hypothetical protein
VQPLRIWCWKFNECRGKPERRCGSFLRHDTCIVGNREIIKKENREIIKAKYEATNILISNVFLIKEVVPATPGIIFPYCSLY